MKTILLTILAAALFCGCMTTKNADGTTSIDTNRLERAASLVRASSAASAIIVLEKNPEEAVYFRLVANVIDAALISDDATLSTLAKSIGELKIKELQSSGAKLAIITALGFQGIYGGDALAGKIRENYAATKLLTALRDGLRAGAPGG